MPDLEVDSRNKNTLKKIIDVIRKTKPSLIITHSSEDYMKDHLEVGKLVFEASFSSSVPHYFSESAFYPHIPQIFYMDTLAGVNFLPEEYVDISSRIDTKLKALDCHES